MRGSVIWITGLSGSGKTTLASILSPLLKTRGEKVVLLDGDDLRAVLEAERSGYDREGRKKLAFIYARFCGLLASQDFTVICSTISLFHDLHRWNRENLPGYFEVFLDVPESKRRKRDSKGLYASVDIGGVENVAGIDVEAEFPLYPDMRITHASGETPVDIVAKRVIAAFYAKLGE
jgi:adenylylsulfate kinase